MHIFFSGFEAVVLALVLSLDAFVVSFAYGADKIKIPAVSVLIINVLCSFILGVSMLAGEFFKQLIPQWLEIAISFTILFLLGLATLFDSVTKAMIRKHNSIKKQIHFNMFQFRCVLSIYADPDKADSDRSKTISPGEAASLAAALSLDGAAVGFGAALGSISPWAVVACSLVTNALAVVLGWFFGNKAAQKIPFNLSWVSGAILIKLAISKLF